MAHERDELATKQTCLKLLTNAQQMCCALCTQPIAVQHKHAKCFTSNCFTLSTPVHYVSRKLSI